MVSSLPSHQSCIDQILFTELVSINTTRAWMHVLLSHRVLNYMPNIWAWTITTMTTRANGSESLFVAHNETQNLIKNILAASNQQWSSKPYKHTPLFGLPVMCTCASDMELVCVRYVMGAIAASRSTWNTVEAPQTHIRHPHSTDIAQTTEHKRRRKWLQELVCQTMLVLRNRY